MKKTKIHILGANGFVGNNLYRDFSSKNAFGVRGYSSKDCDLLSYDSINSKLPKFTTEDIIIMASSITRLRANSSESMTNNITMADNLAVFVQKNFPRQFIFLSTADVYGVNPELPIHEKLLPAPIDYYAISKFSSEFILKSVCMNKIPLLILRLSGIYGKGDEGKSTINRLVKSAINERKIILIGDGSDTRDFVHTNDLCKLIETGIEKETDNIINVATGKSYSIKQIAELVKKNMNDDILIEYEQEEKQKRIKDMRFDISLLKQTFPEFCFRGLEKGLELYIQEHKIF